MLVIKTEQINIQPEADTYFASSVETDFKSRRRLMSVLGSVAIEGTYSSEYVSAERASLPSVIEDYHSEDPERIANGRARLSTDFRTNVFEILCADGDVSTSHSQYQEDGFYQYGYSQRAMYANGTTRTKYLPENRRRTAETLNELRIEDGFLEGRTETHYFVELSPSPDDMPDKVAESLGYGVKTRKLMARLTKVDKWGNRTTLSSPISGVSEQGERYDTKGIANIHKKLNLERANTSIISATDTLESAFWVEKDLLPYEIASIAEAYDEGLDTQAFFGVEGRIGNYETITNESLKRRQQVEQTLDSAVEKLADALRGATEEQALKIMAVHAKDFAAEICGDDLSYDPEQFGPVAARHIRQVRYYSMVGDETRRNQALDQAKQTAIVIMCGMLLDANQSNNQSTGGETSSSGDCEYISEECPLCHAKNVKTYETDERITCGTCKGSVEKTSAPSLNMAA